MPTRAQNVKLAVFLLATTLLMAFVLTVVAGFEFWKDSNTYYVVSGGSVAGLEDGSPVTMRGVRVGKIETLRLDPENADSVRVELAINEGVPVPRNSTALIQLGSLTGTRQIDIVGGDARTGVLPPGSVIPLGESTFEKLERRADKITAQALEVIGKISKLADNLVEISESIEKSVDEERITRLLDRSESSLASIEGAADELETAVGARSGELGQALADVQRASSELRDLLAHSNRILRANDDALQGAIRSFRDTARNFELLSRQLRRQPSSLLRSSPPKERKLP